MYNANTKTISCGTTRFSTIFSAAHYHWLALILNITTNRLTCGTPTPCCREGTPVGSSASERYSESGRRGYRRPRLQYTPHWWPRLGLPDTQCLFEHIQRVRQGIEDDHYQMLTALSLKYTTAFFIA